MLRRSRRWRSALLGTTCLAAIAPAAPAQETIHLPEIVNVAAQTRQTEPENAASEQYRSGERIIQLPYARPGEFLEATPGLIVTQHSGEGKANQYYLRGFNLDHGTDLAITVDGMPVNMRTHAHGQGYADMSFLIPELIASMRIRKGPYFADEGDFSSAGALHIDYIDTLYPGLIAGHRSGCSDMAAGSRSSRWRWAPAICWWPAKAPSTTGPGSSPTGCASSTASSATARAPPLEGFSITGMAYDNRWTSTDQVAKRAIDRGLIDRFGTLDPTDGGRSSRYSISTRMSMLNDWGLTKLEAYGIRYTMTLFNNFTYFLDDPVNGDQFSQTRQPQCLRRPRQSHLPGPARPVRLGNARRHPEPLRRHRCGPQQDPRSGERSRRCARTTCRKAQHALYAQNTTHWTPWLRSIVGGRGDWYQAKVDSNNPLNSGIGARLHRQPERSA